MGRAQSIAAGTAVSGSEAPAPDLETPVAGSGAPASGSETPVPAAEAPVAGSESPVSGPETSVSALETPVSGSVTPVSASVTAVSASGTPASGSETPVPAAETSVPGSGAPVSGSGAWVSTQETAAPAVRIGSVVYWIEGFGRKGGAGKRAPLGTAGYCAGSGAAVWGASAAACASLAAFRAFLFLFSGRMGSIPNSTSFSLR